MNGGQVEVQVLVQVMVQEVVQGLVQELAHARVHPLRPETSSGPSSRTGIEPETGAGG